MTDMTPAPISAERLAVSYVKPYGLMYPDPRGEYVRHSDYAALLHQLAELEAGNAALNAACAAAESKLAERDAEVERLREYVREADRRVGEQFMAAQRAEAEALRLLNRCGEAFDRTRAAERAREEAERDLRAIYEAVPGLPIYATEEDADRATDAFTAICHLCNDYIVSDASGGDRP